MEQIKANAYNEECHDKLGTTHTAVINSVFVFTYLAWQRRGETDNGVASLPRRERAKGVPNFKRTVRIEQRGPQLDGETGQRSCKTLCCYGYLE